MYRKKAGEDGCTTFDTGSHCSVFWIDPIKDWLTEEGLQRGNAYKKNTKKAGMILEFFFFVWVLVHGVVLGLRDVLQVDVAVLVLQQLSQVLNNTEVEQCTATSAFSVYSIVYSLGRSQILRILYSVQYCYAGPPAAWAGGPRY